jgi:hypothetical protein
MKELGFDKDRSRMYAHPNTQFTVEFPGTAALVGNELINEFNEFETRAGILKLLTPTDSAKDRLAAFYHWNDRQGLDQAVWIAAAHPVNLSDIARWSKQESQTEKYLQFLDALKQSKST